MLVKVCVDYSIRVCCLQRVWATACVCYGDWGYTLFLLRCIKVCIGYSVSYSLCRLRYILATEYVCYGVGDSVCVGYSVGQYEWCVVPQCLSGAGRCGLQAEGVALRQSGRSPRRTRHSSLLTAPARPSSPASPPLQAKPSVLINDLCNYTVGVSLATNTFFYSSSYFIIVYIM